MSDFYVMPEDKVTFSVRLNKDIRQLVSLFVKNNETDADLTDALFFERVLEVATKKSTPKQIDNPIHLAEIERLKKEKEQLQANITELQKAAKELNSLTNKANDLSSHLHEIKQRNILVPVNSFERMMFKTIAESPKTKDRYNDLGKRFSLFRSNNPENDIIANLFYNTVLAVEFKKDTHPAIIGGAQIIDKQRLYDNKF